MTRTPTVCPCGWTINAYALPVCPFCGAAAFTAEDEALLRTHAGQVRAGFMEPGPYHIGVDMGDPAGDRTVYWTPPEERPRMRRIRMHWLVELAAWFVIAAVIGLVMSRF